MVGTLEHRAMEAMLAADEEEVRRCLEALPSRSRRALARVLDETAIIARSYDAGEPGMIDRHDFEGDGLWCLRRGCGQIPQAGVHQ